MIDANQTVMLTVPLGRIPAGEVGTVKWASESQGAAGVEFRNYRDSSPAVIALENLQPVIAPIVHLNGTSRESLTEQLENLLGNLSVADNALAEASPNQRDYYPVEGLWEKARKQHEYRQHLLRLLMQSVEAQLLVLSEVPG